MSNTNEWVCIRCDNVNVELAMVCSRCKGPREGARPIQSILLEAEDLTENARNKAYGHPLDDYSRTAALWSAILGIHVSPFQAILCMVAVKISRECNRPGRDNRVDGAGYFKCLDMAHNELQRRNTHVTDPDARGE